MDETPFLEINMLDIKENQVNELKKFHKSQFDIDKIFHVASELKYSNEFKTIMASQLQQPTDDFVRLFLNGLYEGKLMQSVVDKFRPILKKSLNDYINELMSDKIKTALDVNVSPRETEEKEQTIESNVEPVVTAPKIVTTNDELEAYFIIKNTLKEIVPINDITYKDNERYMSILYKEKTTKWICRLYFNGPSKYIAIPNEDKKEIKHHIQNIYEIENHKDELINVLKRYL